MVLWPIIKKLTIFYFFIFLFFFCFIVTRRSDYNLASIVGKPSTKSPNNINNTIITTNIISSNPNKKTSTNTTTYYYPLLTCHQNQTTKCPKPYNNNPSETRQLEPSYGSCPSYFKWIHEDLSPWKDKGITKEMVEKGQKLAFFRLTIVGGKVYVETYKKSFQTRDVFTIWGIVQMLRLYPGMLPDLDLMFECDDKPVIKKSDYVNNNNNEGNDNNNNNVGGVGVTPMFHYCGDDDSYDIPFPDWSFWGWYEINIKPWEKVMTDMEIGNKKLKWMDRAPYAYWKGNLHMGRRKSLLYCNSTQLWNTQIYAQKWAIESKRGFRQSNVADQCTHRYKIYMEGKAWSVSEKYIQACDSMLLLVTPRYYEFFTRSMFPLKHFWPINPTKNLCNSIKFAVDWGNKHPLKAQEIGKEGHRFIEEELKMKNIYDYMFHLLNEYSKLLRYKPSVPKGAIEVCMDTMVCNSFGIEKQWKIDTIVKAPSQISPCVMPPPFDPLEIKDIFRVKSDVFRDVKRWEDSKNVDEVNFD